MSAFIYVMRVLPIAPRRSEERISFKTTESAVSAVRARGHAAQTSHGKPASSPQEHLPLPKTGVAS